MSARVRDSLGAILLLHFSRVGVRFVVRVIDHVDRGEGRHVACSNNFSFPGRLLLVCRELDRRRISSPLNAARQSGRRAQLFASVSHIALLQTANAAVTVPSGHVRAAADIGTRA